LPSNRGIKSQKRKGYNMPALGEKKF